MTNLELVAAELAAAKKKHPKFCDQLVATNPPMTWSASEDAIKLHNATGPFSADCIIMEELAEAFAAVEHGDLAHARQELAQCAAVCIRAMEYVENEMEASK